MEIHPRERGTDKVRHCLFLGDALAAGRLQTPSDNRPGGQAFELEEASVDVKGWFEGSLDTPFPTDSGEGSLAYRGGQGGLEDEGGEPRIGAQEVLGAVVTEECIAEEGEGAVVVEPVVFRGLVYEGTGQGLHGKLGV